MSIENAVAHPEIVTQEQWLSERLDLLTTEKKLTQQLDRVNALRRKLPMVKLTKDYQFDGPDGRQSLLDLFEGRRQLIIYHFMFDPAWEKGCSGCTGLINAMGDLSMLNARDTIFAMISRAPLAKLLKMKADQGWERTWVSSFDSDFNYDFHVTLDEKVTPPQYNFRSKAELQQRKND
ncbi:MAG TPA: DUF899 domain-containing protein, partial [Planctomycetaceae bacterium]|nr:DUF899 domain-containing protein [Planctomycetaceae bacterium]